jgi:hypothetical protein
MCCRSASRGRLAGGSSEKSDSLLSLPVVTRIHMALHFSEPGLPGLWSIGPRLWNLRGPVTIRIGQPFTNFEFP